MFPDGVLRVNNDTKCTGIGYSVQKREEDGKKKVEKRNRAHRKACVDLEIGRRRQWRRWRR